MPQQIAGGRPIGLHQALEIGQRLVRLERHRPQCDWIVPQRNQRLGHRKRVVAHGKPTDGHRLSQRSTGFVASACPTHQALPHLDPVAPLCPQLRHLFGQPGILDAPIQGGLEQQQAALGLAVEQQLAQSLLKHSALFLFDQSNQLVSMMSHAGVIHNEHPKCLLGLPKGVVMLKHILPRLGGAHIGRVRQDLRPKHEQLWVGGRLRKQCPSAVGCRPACAAAQARLRRNVSVSSRAVNSPATSIRRSAGSD